MWMNGGPGASSVFGLLGELGPYLLNNQSFSVANKAAPRLFKNPHSWSKVANVFVLESPAGVGFSYCVEPEAPCTFDDKSTAEDNLDVLLKFMRLYPEFQSNPFFIVGESYGGVYVPMLAKLIDELPVNAPVKPRLVGIGSGNGCVGYAGTPRTDSLRGFVDFMYGHGQISAAVSQAISAACGSTLDSGAVAADFSPACLSAVSKFQKQLGTYMDMSIYSKCKDGQGNWTQGNWGADGSDGAPPTFECNVDGAVKAWLQREDVQHALHVNRSSAGVLPWNEWDGDWPLYKVTMPDVTEIYKNLSTRYRVLIYSGDNDASIPYVSTARWVRSLALPLRGQEWRPWTVDGSRIAGHASEYVGLDYLTVVGAGHMVPAERPREAYEMIARWLHNETWAEYGGACVPIWVGRGWLNPCSSEHNTDLLAV